MRTLSFIAAAALALAACEPKTREADMRHGGTDIIVHEDTAGPAKFLKPPTPIKAARWTEVPVVHGARDDLGPADKRLFVVVTVPPAEWPVWERALTPRPVPGTYFLKEEVAAKLLPPDWLSATEPDSLGRGRRLEGAAYIPDSLATSWYRGVAAVRRGDHLFLEFTSK